VCGGSEGSASGEMISFNINKYGGGMMTVMFRLRKSFAGWYSMFIMKRFCHSRNLGVVYFAICLI